MSFDLAVRATEILLALAFIQQSAEHLVRTTDRPLFAARLVLSLLLLAGIQTVLVCIGLFGLSVLILRKFQGPYNGGSDRMGLLILFCLSLAQLFDTPTHKELAFGYLAIQLLLSYFISGWVKVVNPDWRSGKALRDVFRFSAYPVSEDLRQLALRHRLLWVGSWSVMLLELLFPLTMISQSALVAGLSLTAMFHLANACIFGLNRFLWTWIAAYPSIIWLQDRLVGG